MTSTSLAISTKYPRSKYPPRVACQYCNGTGEVMGKQGVKPCVCLFVQHNMIEISLKVLPAAMLDAMGIDVKALEGKKA